MSTPPAPSLAGHAAVVYVLPTFSPPLPPRCRAVSVASANKRFPSPLWAGLTLLLRSIPFFLLFFYFLFPFCLSFNLLLPFFFAVPSRGFVTSQRNLEVWEGF